MMDIVARISYRGPLIRYTYATYWFRRRNPRTNVSLYYLTEFNTVVNLNILPILLHAKSELTHVGID